MDNPSNTIKVVSIVFWNAVLVAILQRQRQVSRLTHSGLDPPQRAVYTSRRPLKLLLFRPAEISRPLKSNTD